MSCHPGSASCALACRRWQTVLKTAHLVFADLTKLVQTTAVVSVTALHTVQRISEIVFSRPQLLISGSSSRAGTFLGEAHPVAVLPGSRARAVVAATAEALPAGQRTGFLTDVGVVAAAAAHGAAPDPACLSIHAALATARRSTPSFAGSVGHLPVASQS